jgi:hypothetical protein
VVLVCCGAGVLWCCCAVVLWCFGALQLTSELRCDVLVMWHIENLLKD